MYVQLKFVRTIIGPYSLILLFFLNQNVGIMLALLRSVPKLGEECGP